MALRDNNEKEKMKRKTQVRNFDNWQKSKYIMQSIFITYVVLVVALVVSLVV